MKTHLGNIHLNIVPLSVNVCWQGKRFKTPQYKSYEKELLFTLPPLSIHGDNLSLSIEYGVSSKLADIDNPTKPILDILQKKYNFDDKNIYQLNLTKILVPKGQEYIKIEIYGC